MPSVMSMPAGIGGCGRPFSFTREAWHASNAEYALCHDGSAYLAGRYETLRVDVDRETKLQVPFHHLGSVVCLGNIMIPAAMHRCAEDGRFLVLLDHNGRFKARLEGPVCGNILLRQAQHRLAPVKDAGHCAISPAGKLRIPAKSCCGARGRRRMRKMAGR